MLNLGESQVTGDDRITFNDVYYCHDSVQISEDQ
jgi:hypothetical protein